MAAADLSARRWAWYALIVNFPPMLVSKPGGTVVWVMLLTTSKKERQEAGWRSWEEVRTASDNREEWKSSVKALCATRHITYKQALRMGYSEI